MIQQCLLRHMNAAWMQSWMFLTSFSHHECHWSVRSTFCSCPCWWIRGLAIITLPMWMLSFIWASTKHAKLHWHSRCETAVKDIQLCIHAAVDPERATQRSFQPHIIMTHDKKTMISDVFSMSDYKVTKLSLFNTVIRRYTCVWTDSQVKSSLFI